MWLRRASKRPDSCPGTALVVRSRAGERKRESGCGAGGIGKHRRDKPMVNDTQVEIISESNGYISVRGYLSIHGVKVKGGQTNLGGYSGHYLTPRSQLRFSPECPISADHHFDLGPIGYLSGMGLDDVGLVGLATLLPVAQDIVFEAETRSIPVLLRENRLYYCMELNEVELADDGELLSAMLIGVALTEHPG